MDKKDFNYYTYEVGRENYKPEIDKLIWNVIAEDNGRIYVQNLFEYNWVFLEKGLLEAKKKYSDDFTKFAEHIREWLQHEYWSRSQYEIIVSNWVGKDCEYKLDVYTQVMLNWDKFIEYIWDNKKLITKKKLGLGE